MMYLIGQLSGWLLLTAVFAGVAGWAFAAERGAPREHASRRERENLVRDILKLATEDADVRSIESEREADAIRRQLEISAGRSTELESALENARRRADGAAAEAAELQRRLEQMQAEAAQQREQALTVAAEPVEESGGDADLQAWRLRYFEQRVRYLEGQAREAVRTTEPELEPVALEWRAREAEARADYLAQELRTAAASELPAAAEEEPTPFAANADVDMLLRWRMLYLERRVAHLQKQAAPGAEQESAVNAEADRWKWRARYLEARLRHLEQPAAAPPLGPLSTAADAVQPEQPAPPPEPAVTPRKPPVLAAARDGAPDDLTLIDGVSQLQQITLNAMGVFHFDQIASWTPENVAWVARYLRLEGRIAEDEWVEQAHALAREGPAAARRIAEDAL